MCDNVVRPPDRVCHRSFLKSLIKKKKTIAHVRNVSSSYLRADAASARLPRVVVSHGEQHRSRRRRRHDRVRSPANSRRPRRRRVCFAFGRRSETFRAGVRGKPAGRPPRIPYANLLDEQRECLETVRRSRRDARDRHSFAAWTRRRGHRDICWSRLETHYAITYVYYPCKRVRVPENAFFFFLNDDVFRALVRSRSSRVGNGVRGRVQFATISTGVSNRVT